MVANFRAGLVLVSVAVFLWGTLPIALKLVLPHVDAVTLTWFRFICAFTVTLLLQIVFKRLGDFRQLSAKHWGILTLAMMGSIGNYILFVVSLHYLSGPTAQLIFQVAPIMMAIGGVLFYQEKISAIQILNFAGVIVGMLLFFNKELLGLAGHTQLLIGMACVFFSALSWVIYTLLQKSLIGRISSSNILLYIYFCASVLLLPFAVPEKIALVNNDLMPVLIFLSLNTLIAYESFTRALKHWPVSRIGAALPLVPVIAFVCTYLLHTWQPSMIEVDTLNLGALIGVLLVTVCSIGASTAGRRASKEAANAS